jgi:hypothetical protein
MEFSASAGGWVQTPAPTGYKWDPVGGNWAKTPTQAGTEVNQFSTAANPSLAALQGQLSGAFSGGLSGFGGGTGSTSGGGYTGSTSGTSGSGTSGVTGGARLPTLQLPDQTAGTNAAYATAKDKVGASGRASIDALRGELGSTGMLGGGAEAQSVQQAVTGANAELGQVARDQAGKSADLSADFAKTNYVGGVTQRGQDVSASEAAARLAQEQRLADANLSFQRQQAASSQQLQMLQLALSGLKAMPSGSGLY